MVSVRLSHEEYSRFQTICESRGIRSLSDLARTAMQRMEASHDGADPLWHEVGTLRNQIRGLSLELERITKQLEQRNPTLDPAHGRD
jgi:hypothetical protein